MSVRRNGSLSFRPLSPGSDDTSPSYMYNPGVIGGWYSLSSGFIDTVRSGSLPYGIIHKLCHDICLSDEDGLSGLDAIKDGLQSLNVPCSVAGLRNDCTSGRTVTTSTFNPNELIQSVSIVTAGQTCQGLLYNWHLHACSLQLSSHCIAESLRSAAALS